MTDFIAANAPVIAIVILIGLFIAFALEKYPPEVTATVAAALFVVRGLGVRGTPASAFGG